MKINSKIIPKNSALVERLAKEVIEDGDKNWEYNIHRLVKEYKLSCPHLEGHLRNRVMALNARIELEEMKKNATNNNS